MKEIGMKKLIELLKDQHGEVVTYNIQSDGGYMFHICGFAVREERLLSKKFGFIKWLVENDKIDLDKIGRFKAERKNTQIIAIANKSDFYLSLLMILAIQDEPIRFLCEIIK